MRWPTVCVLVAVLSGCPGPGAPAAPVDTAPVAGSEDAAGAADGVAEPRAEPERRVRLCAWNVKKLGHGSRKDHPLVAAILEDHCDLAVVVEVMQRGGGHPGWDALLDALGDGWTGVVTDTPRPNTNAGHAEYYGVAWRPSGVDVCDGWEGLRHFPDHDGGPNGTGPDLFSREPAYGCFVAGRFDFLLGAYHATWSGGSTTEIAGEVENLGEVFRTMEASRPGERDLVIAGDFNLRPDDLADAVPYWDRTTGTGSTLNSSGERTENLYDHFLVEDKDRTVEMPEDGVVLDVVDRAESPRAFYRTVSDHLPIAVDLLAHLPDDD